jgi:hypothetical protein
MGNKTLSREMKRIKHNDLTHYFIREHSTLPAAYLASCEKFFKSIKRQASSTKRQASSSGRVGPQASSGSLE